MIQIKKTILTLVALFAVTAGAWAQDAFGVKEIVPPADWEIDGTNATKGDFPGFVGITIDQAKAWTGAPSSGLAVLFYNFDGEDISYAYFLNGTFNSSGSNIIQRFNIYNSFANGVKQYYTASAASTVEVAWDKAKKTGSFKMPGGNVTLEPEYYPQATLAFQGLTAAVDAAAKTEAPLAVVADGAVTGGTLMYYVATDKNFSQADAIALAETQWSADIPTAETIEAAGTYIMWYYIKGDAEHSDTDPIPLAVTLLPEPTYTVEFAEGTPETDKWKADPAAGVTKGQTVTVNYTGSKKVIGVKAEKKKAAEKTITIGEQNYTVLNGETWKQFITRNQLSGWYLDQMTLSTWGVYINEPFSKLHVSSDGTNWTQLVLSSQDAPIDTDKQYKWVQEEIGGGGAPF